MFKFFVFFLMFFFNCTGLNLRTWPLSVAPNTHPLPDYAEARYILKGGYLYHLESRIKQVSEVPIVKKGRACVHSLLYLGAWGDARIDTAKVEGGIARVGLLEQEVFAILGGVYHRHCTILLGE